MAIALDTSSKNGGANVTTLTHTCTGSNLILVVAALVYSTGGGFGVSGITYNGVAMTLLGTTTGNGGLPSYLYYLVNPATGSHTITITNPGSGTQYNEILAASYTGVDQISPIDASSQATNVVGNYSKSITTTTSDCWLVWGCGKSGTGSGFTNCVLRQDAEFALGSYYIDSNGAQGAPGSKTISWSAGGADYFYGWMAAIKPVQPLNNGAGFFAMI